VGGYAEGIEASRSRSSRKAHYVGIGPQEDRGGTAGEMGEGAGGAEEGGVELVRVEVRSGRIQSATGVGAETGDRIASARQRFVQIWASQ